jgi:hypothetical protein
MGKPYGNARSYIEGRLRREGFGQLARRVSEGRLSAQFAVTLARTVPRKRLNTVIKAAEFLGPNRPPDWEWRSALELWAKYH